MSHKKSTPERLATFSDGWPPPDSPQLLSLYMHWYLS
jgi:hypothetical protein